MRARDIQLIVIRHLHSRPDVPRGTATVVDVLPRRGARGWPPCPACAECSVLAAFYGDTQNTQTAQVSCVSHPSHEHPPYEKVCATINIHQCITRGGVGHVNPLPGTAVTQAFIPLFLHTDDHLGTVIGKPRKNCICQCQGARSVVDSDRGWKGGDRRTALLWRRRARLDHAALQPIQLIPRQSCGPSRRWRPVQICERERTYECRPALVERNLRENFCSIQRWRTAQKKSERSWTCGCHTTVVRPKKHHGRTTKKKNTQLACLKCCNMRIVRRCVCL